jgi:phage-related minor tail protein
MDKGQKNKMNIVETEQQLKKLKIEEELKQQREQQENHKKNEEKNEENEEVYEDDFEKENEIIEKEDENIKYKLTKNEYLIYLYKNLLIGECDILSLVKYILQSLPGLTDEERYNILVNGPNLDSYASKKDMQLYAYSRLIQYQYSDTYKNFKCDLPLIPKYSSLKFNLHCEEDIKNHLVYFTKEPNLK